MKVYSAINAVQAALATEGISKARKNTQQGYNFRGIDDIYNVVSPLLAQHGLCILPRMLSRHCEERTTAKGGVLFYVTVEAEFDFVAAEDGSKHTVKTYGEAMDSGDKATNKAQSAAYKYAVMQAFAIPTEGDNDADATTHGDLKPSQQQRPAASKNAGKEPRQDLAQTVANIVKDVKGGNAKQPAEWLASLPEAEMNAIWAKLSTEVQDELTSNWPEVAA